MDPRASPGPPFRGKPRGMNRKRFKQVTDKYGALPATAENIEAMRLELLDKAQIQQAVDDPRIREILTADGIDPESLRIPT